MKIIYHRSTRPTASALADSFGCGLIEDLSMADPGEPVVNWGRRLSNPENHILNGGHSMTKCEALVAMKEHGVNVPSFLAGDLLVRRPRTRGGRGIRRHHGFVTEFIPKDFEFRVDVFLGKATRIHVKTGDPDRVSWNRDGSEWVTFGSRRMRSNLESRFGIPRETADEVISQAKRAARAMRLDFGAVDLIRSRESGSVFVLEVNTAPSLGESGIRKYKKLITRWLGGDFDDVR